jgi:hypothetical protein
MDAGRNMARFSRYRGLKNIPIVVRDIAVANAINGNQLAAAFPPARYIFFDTDIKNWVEKWRP